jgi:hypothetical protein
MFDVKIAMERIFGKDKKKEVGVRMSENNSPP